MLRWCERVAPATRALPIALVTATIWPAAVAFGAPPVNDNYLASTTINRPDGSLPRQYTDQRDTTEATTQADLFNPNRDGLPFGGGDPELTSCVGVPQFGKTVWYDFAPPSPGGVRLVASGFDAVIAVYEWSLETSRITATVACQSASTGTSEEVLLGPQVRGGRNYTIQVGGVADAGGTLDFSFEYFRDRDGDGVLDEQPDKCRTLPGIPAFGGCPPLVPGTAVINFARTGSGIVVERLTVARTPFGTRIRVSCRRCGRAVNLRQRRRGRVLRVRGFEGRALAAGDRIVVGITHPRTDRGRYRFGAIGKRLTWRIVPGGVEPLQARCTRPGSRRGIRCP